MAKNNSHTLALLPGIVWIIAGTRLLLKAISGVFSSQLSFFTSLLLSMLAWGLSSIKYQYILRNIAKDQHIFAIQFISKKISARTYLKKAFFSRRFLILVAMIFLSTIVKRFVSHPGVLFVIRATIGYALIKTATSYFATIQKTLSQA